MVEKDQRLVNFNWILTLDRLRRLNLDGLKFESSTVQFLGPNRLSLERIYTQDFRSIKAYIDYGHFSQNFIRIFGNVHPNFNSALTL